MHNIQKDALHYFFLLSERFKIRTSLHADFNFMILCTGIDVLSPMQKALCQLHHQSHPVRWLRLQTVGLVLELLNLPRDLSHLAALAEVDEALCPLTGVLGPVDDEVAVPFLRQQDVGQVHTCPKDTQG